MEKLRKNMRRQRNKNCTISRARTDSAITLIALVITIIVLLILAGVAIATLTGENRTNSQSK